MTLLYVIITMTVLAIATPFILKLIFPHEITNEELVGSVIGSIAITLFSLGILYFNASNTELWHGQVTNKNQVKVSCSHSYSCNCTTDSKGNTSCSTCYEHSHDFDWRVYTSVGEFNIDRLDSRGLKEPARFTSIEINEPVSRENRYIDYVGNSSHSLYNLEQYATSENKDRYGEVAYPRVYDYYNVKLVVDLIGQTKLSNELSNEIRLALRRIGFENEVNIVVVLTNHDRKFGNYLQYHWNNGRKNDQIVVIGVDSTEGQNHMNWAYAFGYSSNQMVNVELRDKLQSLKTINDVQEVGSIITATVSKHYVRTPMAEFKYLASEIEISNWMVFFMMLLQIGGNITIALVILNNDVKEYNYRRRK